MSRYIELKNQHPTLEECFFAFSDKQFNEAVEKGNFKDKKILRAGSGLFGTKEGLDKMNIFYDNVKATIKNECSPQMVYDYEYNNHECDYTGTDKEALDIVLFYFGDIKDVKR